MSNRYYIIHIGRYILQSQQLYHNLPYYVIKNRSVGHVERVTHSHAISTPSKHKVTLKRTVVQSAMRLMDVIFLTTVKIGTALEINIGSRGGCFQ